MKIIYLLVLISVNLSMVLASPKIGKQAFVCKGGAVTATWFQVDEQYLYQYSGLPDDSANNKWVMLTKENAGTGFNLKNKDGNWLSSRATVWSGWTIVEIYTNSKGFEKVKCHKDVKSASKLDTSRMYKQFNLQNKKTD